ncbi:WD40 repeat [Neorhodopirellula lusitana]|uniref:WD40 repeat n=2 Tax=Neorhodopirellula lusitana TaxID=445327 RepID=A0ABY1PNI1_9BACT|nr:WD40 repeat [Neorhodopirellula lusitana]
MRIAKSRAARNRAAAADAEKAEKQKPAVSKIVKAESDDKKPVPVESNKAEVASKKDASNERQPVKEAIADTVDKVVEKASQLEKLLDGPVISFSRYGESVAFSGTSQSVAYFDVESQELVRQAFNPDITPTSLAVNTDLSDLVVGGAEGTFRVFSLTGNEGLDRFQANRQLQREVAKPRLGHEGRITATAINQEGDLIATADADGSLKLWSSSLEDPMILTNGGSSLAALVAYKNDEFVLGTNQDNQVLYWSIGKSQFEAKPFPNGTLASEPTCLRTGFEGKGFLVGEASGQVTMWLPENKQLKRTELHAHQEPIEDLRILEGGRILVTASQSGEILRWDLPITDESTGTPVGTPDAIPSKLIRLADNGAFAVMVNQTGQVQVVPLSQEPGPDTIAACTLETGDIQVQQLVVHPVIDRVAAIGRDSSTESDELLIWSLSARDLSSNVAKVNTTLKSRPIEIAYSSDGSLLAVGYHDGRCEVRDGSSGEMLEELPVMEGLSTVAFTVDGSRLLLGKQDGSVAVHGLSARGTIRVSDSRIVSLGFLENDRFLIAATSKGELVRCDRTVPKGPHVRLKGIDASVRVSAVSGDGDSVLAAFDDEQNSVAVWNTTDIVETTDPIEPESIVQVGAPVTSATFSSDSKYLIAGCLDGLIRIWSLSEKREVAHCKGHEGPVIAIAPLQEAGRFVSGGSDKLVRSWDFPTKALAPEDAIPSGRSFAQFRLLDLVPPRINRDSGSSDPLDAARQALIAGKQGAANALEVLDLITGDNETKAKAKESLRRILLMEEKHTATGEQLSNERRRLSVNRRDMVESESSLMRRTYSGGFSNLFFAAPTNFVFGLDPRFRPVELLFSDKFLYASRPSSKRPPERKRGRYRNVQEVHDIVDKKTDRQGNAIDKNGNRIMEKEDPDSIDGDNGALLSWDYRYSQLQAHAWSVDDLRVSELHSLPNSVGVLSVPQVMVFNQNGTSREFPVAESWATTSWPNQDKQFLAIGTAGGNRVESDILKIFGVSSLQQEVVKPVSQYRSFEGIITAMAFANTQPKIAFAVRERSVHRVFVADIETMSLSLVEEFAHPLPWVEEKKGVVTRNTKASPGPTTLAFAPDDSLLIAHGQYKKKMYRFTGWKLDEDLHPLLLKPQFEVENNKEPFFDRVGGTSVWFINSDRYGRQDRDPSSSRVKKIVVRRKGGFSVINLATGSVEREIKYLKTQHGQPIYDISSNGRWIAMGDDKGMAFLWDAITGERFSMTIDDETEQRIKAAERTPRDLPERPAHTGPIAGIALSEPDAGKEYPAFAATFGEENRVKVWELFPIIELQSQTLRPRETTASRQTSPVNRSPTNRNHAIRTEVTQTQASQVEARPVRATR